MTLAQRFTQKARELLPHQDDLQNLDPALDDPEAIDAAIFRRSEYLGGMATAILALIARENGVAREQRPVVAEKIAGTLHVKQPQADVHAKAEAMLREYRNALDTGLGSDSDRYELGCLHTFVGQKLVGLAYSADLQRAFLLFADAERPRPDYEPLWLLDAARELTMLMRTLVVPDQAANGTTLWGGLKHGPIVAYRFKLADGPRSIKF